MRKFKHNVTFSKNLEEMKKNINYILSFKFKGDREVALSFYDQDLVKEVRIERIRYNQLQETEYIPEEYA